MGDTHFRSNIKGKDGTEKIENFNCIKFGTGNGIVFGTANTAATQNAAASTALGGPLTPGCLYLSTKAAGGGLYVRQSAAASWTRLIS